MLRSSFKALLCFAVSLCLAPIPAVLGKSVPPEPGDSRFLPLTEPWTPATLIDSLVETLVVGRWEIDSRELGQKEDPQYRYRWVFHFFPDRTVEMRIWLKDGYGGAEGDPPAYFGLEQAGDWFIRDGRIGIISRQCFGFTAAAQRECDDETDEIGDTSYQILQRQENGIFLAADESAVVRFSFKGRDQDMSAPAFWPAGQSLEASMRDKRKARDGTQAAPRKAPAFDAKGRVIAPGTAESRTGGGNGPPFWHWVRSSP